MCMHLSSFVSRYSQFYCGMWCAGQTASISNIIRCPYDLLMIRKQRLRRNFTHEMNQCTELINANRTLHCKYNYINVNTLSD